MRGSGRPSVKVEGGSRAEAGRVMGVPLESVRLLSVLRERPIVMAKERTRRPSRK